MSAWVHLLRRRARAAVGVVAALALVVLTASAQAAPVELSVSIIGAEEGAPPRGKVSSIPAGIDCPTICSATFASGSAVMLIQTPVAGYALREWNALPNDQRCMQPPDCTVTIGATTVAVSAFFQPAAQLSAVTAGPGTLTIDPAEPGLEGTCAVDAQQLTAGACVHRYATGTRVTVTAAPAIGASFGGWSDYRCRNTALSCTLVMAGEQFLTARFSPVSLTIQGDAFGGVRVSPAPGGFCALMLDSPPCTVAFRSGTIVLLRREHAAPGLSWVGACEGNAGGLLDADVCRLRLQGNELVGAGYDNVTAIPPPLGSGIHVALTGKTRGKVTGSVVNSGQTLNCGSRCTISGLTRYDTVLLTATKRKGGRFVGWSDGSTRRKRTLQVASVNNIKATFAQSSSRRR